MNKLINLDNAALGKSIAWRLQGVLLLLFLGSCQKLKPESVDIPEYPDFKSLMTEQIEVLSNKGIKKEVSLDGNSEFKELEMDSTKWVEELSFLEEVNPNQSEYVGAFEKSINGSREILTLREGEKGSLKKVSYQKSDDHYQSIQISFHEDKDVYTHHKEIEINFNEGVISSLRIDGYQKMMLKDTVRFRIEININ